MHKWILIALTAFTLTVGSPAFAGSDPVTTFKMEKTGSAKLDAVFDKATDPLGKLGTAKTDIHSGRIELNQALGVADDTPFKDALEKLKAKGNGKIGMAMEGKVPTLKVEEGAPPGLNKGVNAVNKMSRNMTRAAKELASIPNDIQAVVGEAQKFAQPASLTKLGLSPLKVPAAVKKVTGNIKVLGKGGQSAKELVNEIAGMTSDIQSTFGG